MVVLLFFLISYILFSIGLFFLFPKMNEAGWKGLVPGLNFMALSKLTGRKESYAAWMLFPIVNFFIYAYLCIDLVRSFGKYTFFHSLIAVVASPVIIGMLAFNDREKYMGPSHAQEKEYLSQIDAARAAKDERKLKKLIAQNPFKKSPIREWVDAVVFAVFAAAFIRMFLIEAYVIPTSSMEGSLLVGDFLFVSKANYGIRTPQTVAMIPLLHNRIPGIESESYFEKPNLPYFRLPALEKIDHNEPVVFNYPEGDSVYIFPGRTWSIHDYRRGSIPNQFAAMIESGQAPLVTRPIDKKDHYIKRCIGLPGDSLQIIDRVVYLNGKEAEQPTHLQFMYRVQFPAGPLNTSNWPDWGISAEDIVAQPGPGLLIMVLSEDQKARISGMDSNIEITPVDMGALNEEPGRLFPHDSEHYPDWNVDNYGPIFIPQKGKTISLTPENISFYRRIISVYENNDLIETTEGYIINGQPTDSYTFQMDYYWMMGDNRHNSEDSRVWGFVPEDHVVGKPLFIWFSTKEGEIGKGINWNRIFTSANKS